MKILHVITSLTTGGAEHLMVDLLPQLRDLGNEVELLVFDGTRTPFYEQLEQKDITIHSLGIGGNVYNPLNMFKLTKYIGRYDIIHTHNTACQFFAPMAKMLRLSRTKLVTTEHNATNRRRGKWYLKPIDRWMYAHYNHIICIADQTYDNLVNYIGQAHHISIIYNGVDVSRFLGPVKDVAGQQSFLVTMIAAFREQKDQDTLIKAIAELPANYRLRIVGDGARRNALEELVRNLDVGNRVEFTGIRTDIPELLHESDVNVLSSHWEGLSLSSIEGMASGRPFVASDVDGLREIVQGCGILFPHSDHRALASAIQQLCENPQHYRDVAERCQAKAKQFDISLMAQQYNELYLKL